MKKLLILPSILTATAVAALLAPQVFAQGASVANTTTPYTATAPADGTGPSVGPALNRAANQVASDVAKWIGSAGS